MRSPTSDLNSKLLTALGTEPFYILEVKFSTGTKWYAGRDFAIPNRGPTCEGKLLEVGNISSSKKQDSLGVVSAVNITLDDYDGKLAILLETTQLENTKCVLYQFFDGLNYKNISNDINLLTLMEGIISNPIEWSEGKVTIRFDMETRILDQPIGYAPASGEVQNEEAVDTPLPLCFGSVVHVPCVRITKPVEDYLVKPFVVSKDATFEVNDASFFPSGTLTLEINNILFRGTFNGNIFTVQEHNYPKYQNLLLGARPSTDLDKNSPWVAWLQSYKDILDHYIIVKDEFGNALIVQILRQIGTKLYFSLPMYKASGAAYLLDGGLSGLSTKIIEVAKLPRDAWGLYYDASGGFLGVVGGYNWNAKFPLPFLPDLKPVIEPGTRVRQFFTNNVYVSNLIESTSIKGVYAERTDEKGLRKFVSIPTKYYTKSLADMSSISGKTLTTLTFNVALEDLTKQGWGDQIYVTLKSSIGPNPSDIIKWLLQTYSNISIDTPSFDFVKTKLTNYPMGFTLNSQPNVLAVCERIAWQARCALVVNDGIAKLRFLGTRPNPVDETLTACEGKIQDKSFVFAEEPIEETVTKFVAKWSPYSYKWRKMHRWEEEVVIKNNISQFGLREESFDFFAYNIRTLVTKAASFWANRKSRIWRRAKFNMFKRGLRYEIFDSLKMSYASGYLDEWKTDFTTSPIIVNHIQVNQDETISLEVWTPIESGTVIESSAAWQIDNDILPADPIDRYSELDYDIAVPYEWETSIGFTVGQSGPSPAKIASIVDDVNIPGRKYVIVDVHESGFSPPTMIGIPAELVDPTAVNSLVVGDRVTITRVKDTYWVISTAKTFPVVIKGGSNPYTWKRLVLNSDGTTTETGDQKSNAYELNTSTVIAVGTKVFLHATDLKDTNNNDIYYFWFPVEDC